MRHRKDTAKLGRTTSHKRCMIANMLKSLINNESIVTTIEKAKELRRHADKMITLAKRNDLSSRRRAIAALMVRFNSLTSKEARITREGSDKRLNDDRKVIEKLFGELGTRFSTRQGGYTRIIRSNKRAGDNAQKCVIEFLPE
ncbi:MAG: 50S ribosomal protein L17 [Chlamydiota bacterium]